MKFPKTDEEWQEAVDAADGALALHSARAYGLVTGGPAVDVARCEMILSEGAKRKFMPSTTAVEEFIAELLIMEKEASNATAIRH